jgi:glycosyltransferase involved in cell wall biosynthesis
LTVIPGLAPDSVELLQALKTAYCFILPSRHEPFGIAALEALDAGAPLIASAVGGLKDFLVDGKMLFCLKITILQVCLRRMIKLNFCVMI